MLVVEVSDRNAKCEYSINGVLQVVTLPVEDLVVVLAKRSEGARST